LRRHMATALRITLVTSNTFAQSTAFRRSIDLSQAELFLRFLRAQATGGSTAPLVDSILHHPGTALVIRQQNISRSVTGEQYRTVLLQAADSAPPPLTPTEGERGRR